MKATINTTIMLMMMTIGTLAASAQSAQRGTPHNTDNRKTTASVASKSDKQRQTQVSDTRQPTNYRSEAQKHQSSQPATNQKQNERPQKSAVVARSSNQKTSTTNNRNPKSNYREPVNNTHVGKTYLDPKSRSNYSSNHNAGRNYTTVVNHNAVRHYNSGYYYPQSRVKVHVHPTTYRNHYKVMYYPAHRDIVWTRKMHNYYMGIYPGYTWRYPAGYRIQTISAFEARYNVGEVARVYGRVYGTWYNRETDDLLLFFGGEFPYQEFTMILPGEVARRYSWKPERYFLGQHVMATGLVTSYEGKPEMVVKRRHQLDVY